MDKSYYVEYVWPHMFYIPAEDLWRFQMNAARAMGNSLDPKYINDLKRCILGEYDERVKEMAAWALEKITGSMGQKNSLSK
jgi:epoxyqueuosine reductase